MVYYNATITFYGPQTSPTTIFTPLTVAILATFRHWHFYRQSGTCIGIIYPFYAHITVRACTYMFVLEFQLVIPYHNRHTHCPRLSPSVMSDLGMVHTNTGAQYMRIRIFRISLQGPGGLNKHTEWLIGCPRSVWRGNLQGFGLVDYIFRFRSA